MTQNKLQANNASSPFKFFDSPKRRLNSFDSDSDSDLF